MVSQPKSLLWNAEYIGRKAGGNYTIYYDFSSSRAHSVHRERIIVPIKVSFGYL